MIPVSVKKLEESVHVKHRIRNAFSLWWLGMINNFHYTLVLAGSDGIAEGYGMKKYVALITFANVFLWDHIKFFSRLCDSAPVVQHSRDSGVSDDD
ncbi:hypothetical protein, conserved, partial [Trypanosoma cruzi]